jgi:hypothetical protein
LEIKFFGALVTWISAPAPQNNVGRTEITCSLVRPSHALALAFHSIIFERHDTTPHLRYRTKREKKTKKKFFFEEKENPL